MASSNSPAVLPAHRKRGEPSIACTDSTVRAKGSPAAAAGIGAASSSRAPVAPAAAMARRAKYSSAPALPSGCSGEEDLLCAGIEGELAVYDELFERRAALAAEFCPDWKPMRDQAEGSSARQPGAGPRAGTGAKCSAPADYRPGQPTSLVWAMPSPNESEIPTKPTASRSPSAQQGAVVRGADSPLPVLFASRSRACPTGKSIGP